MKRLLASVILVVAAITPAGAATFAGTGTTVAIVTPPSWTPVSGPVFDLATTATKSYFFNMLSHRKAFFASVTPHYVLVTRNGKKHHAGTVFGLAQAKKLSAGSIIDYVTVGSLTQRGNQFSESVRVNENASVIDSAGARQASTSTGHQLILERKPNGTFLVARDTVTS